MCYNVIVHIDLEPVGSGKLLRILRNLLVTQLGVVTKPIHSGGIPNDLVALLDTSLGEDTLILLRG